MAPGLAHRRAGRIAAARQPESDRAASSRPLQRPTTSPACIDCPVEFGEMTGRDVSSYGDLLVLSTYSDMVVLSSYTDICKLSPFADNAADRDQIHS